VSIAEGMAVGVASGLISAWLYDKLKRRKVEKIIIEKLEKTSEKPHSE